MTKYYCEHGKQKTYCKDCGGSGICEHRIQRRYCKDCGGSRVCEHRKQRRFCKDCIEFNTILALVMLSNDH